MSDLSWLNPTPHAIAVYASQPLSPVATQHSLPSGRYSLLGPDFHRLDRTSFAWRTHSITSSARASSVGGTSRPSALAVLRLMTSSYLVGCLHRQVGRLLALEDAVDVAGRAPVLVDDIRPVGDQAAAGDEGAVGVDRGQLVPSRQRDDQIRDERSPTALAVTIRPPFAERANAVTARSISPASRTSTGLNSTPNDGATAWMAPNWPVPAGMAGSRRTAARVTPGAICFEQLQPFPAQAVFEDA